VAKGKIARLMRDRGYGFITTEGGKDIFFHRTGLRGLRFDSLREGQPVEFETEEGAHGEVGRGHRESRKRIVHANAISAGLRQVNPGVKGHPDKAREWTNPVVALFPCPSGRLTCQGRA
jgi:CspA family cold shock protein